MFISLCVPPGEVRQKEKLQTDLKTLFASRGPRFTKKRAVLNSNLKHRQLSNSYKHCLTMFYYAINIQVRFQHNSLLQAAYAF